MSKFRVGNSRFSRFMNGKGFYIALALCLVAIGSAAYIATNNTMGLLNGGYGSSSSITSKTGTTLSDIDWNDSAQPTNNTVSGIPANDSNSINASSSVASRPNSSKLSTAGTKDWLFMLPCAGDVISPSFSGDNLVLNKTFGDYRVQTGDDIAAKLGTPVVAAADGTVYQVIKDPNNLDLYYGAMVIIDHGNGIKTVYGNLTTNVTVTKGQHVNAGDVIGCIGNTAQGEISLVSHLYFAMTKNNAYIDPFTFVKKQ